MTKRRLFFLCLVYAAIGCAFARAQEPGPGKLIGVTPHATAQQSIDGYWEGFVERQGAKMVIKVEFNTATDGVKAVIEIPDCYVHGYKLTNVRYEPPSLHFELQLSREPDKFDGEFKGEFIEGNYAGRFNQAEARSAHLILWRLK